MHARFCTALLLSVCAAASGCSAPRRSPVGEYYIQSGYIYGPKMSGKFYILNRYIYGPKNNGAYYIQLGYVPTGIGPYYIYGPKKGGLYYIQNNYIFGPPGELPWMED
jgi:hypothetical protein